MNPPRMTMSRREEINAEEAAAAEKRHAKEESKKTCVRCHKEVRGNYKFCFECREKVLEEERIRDAIFIRICGDLGCDSDVAAPEVARRAWDVAQAAIVHRKAKS